MKQFYLIILFLSFICGNICGQHMIPIKYDGHIYVNGNLDNSSASNFIFDTGASVFYIDSCYLEESGVKFKKFANAFLPGAGTNHQKVKVILDTLTYCFSNNIYIPSYGVIFNLRPILGDFADGIIGNEYFASCCLEINYKDGYMKKYESVSNIDLNEFVKLEGVNVKGKIKVPLTIKVGDLTIMEYFLLDLGSGGSVNLNSTFADKYNIDNRIERKRYFYTSQGGVGGSSESYTFVLPEVSLGDFVIKDVLSSRSLDQHGALASSDYAGLLGNDILSRFVLVIDYKTSTIYLKENDDFDNEFEGKTFGFSFANRFKTDGGYWQVNGFYRNSSAEKMLKVGDKIRTINNMSVCDINTFAIQNEVLEKKVLQLKIERQGVSESVIITEEDIFQ